MTNYPSPYAKFEQTDWVKITNDLVKAHPLKEQEIVDFYIAAWESLFDSSIGRHGLKIGEHIFPKPQIIGLLLHELIPAELKLLRAILAYGKESKKRTTKILSIYLMIDTR